MQNFLKAYLATFFTPTPLIGFLLLMGLIFLWKRKNIAKLFLLTSISIFLLFSTDPLAEYLLNNFENAYPALKPEEISREKTSQIKYVVVLAGGYFPYEKHPLTTELGAYTLTRLVEGVRLAKKLPLTKLVVTGKGWAKSSEASAMKHLALDLGIEESRIIIEEESMNTFAHTIYLNEIIQDSPFILVTSALHMPRAMGIFKKAGYSPLPAPTGHYLQSEYSPFSLVEPFPKGNNLTAMDDLFLEYYGIIWAKLRGEM